MNLAISASDGDGNPLTYSATGLPAGLSIGSSTGRITGTPTTQKGNNVIVTVSDGQASATATFTWTLVTPDTTAPTNPSGFTVTLSNGRPSLAWSASTDAVGVAGYIIRRSTNGTEGPEIARTSSRAWIDSGTQEGVKYTYAIRAYDAAGNVSGRTSLKSITAFQIPSTPGGVTIALVSGDPRVQWNASTDNVGVVGYIIYRSTNGGNGSEIARTSARTYTDTSARAGTRYTYNIRAYDAAGYLSDRSALVSIKAQ